MRFGFDPANNIRDLAGNTLTGTMSSPLIHIDNTGPSAAAITPVNPGYWPNPNGPTNDTVVRFTVQFNEPVMNFGLDDVLITQTGTVTHTNTSVLPATGPASTYTVRFSGITGIGTLSMSVDTTGDIVDRVGNPIESSVTSLSVIFLEDTDAPYCTAIYPTTSSPTNDNTVYFAVAFSEPVYDFDGTDLLFSKSGTVGFTTATVSPTTGVIPTDAYTVAVHGVTGDGRLWFRVDTDGDVKDTFHNPLQSSVVGDQLTIDNTPPAILFNGPDPVSTSDGPVEYTVIYDDLHFDTTSITLSAADITVLNVGKAAPTVVVSGTAPNQRLVTISDLAGSDIGAGEVAIQVTRVGTAYDLAGNTAPISGESDPFTVEEGMPLAWWPLAIALMLAAALVFTWRRERRAGER
ncbi:MAG TPA: hypothetical protein ENN80_01845 [Candidatus Hydrogenedentes bacterium]|nr:hypothetical protein [Candidatus Hydrogenedentota bacterium]